MEDPSQKLLGSLEIQIFDNFYSIIKEKSVDENDETN